MSICARMTILLLSIVLHCCLTKTSNLAFIGYHNVVIFPLMVVTTSVHAPSWQDDTRVCALTRFVPYSLHKFRITSSFSYLWLWHLSVLTLCHVLSANYVSVRLVHLFSFLLCLHAVKKCFHTIFLCLHVVSFPVSLCIHAGFDYWSSCIHVGLYFFLVWPNLNHISRKTGPDFPTDPSGTPLELSEEEGTSDSQLRIALNQTKHQHKWMVTHLTFSDKLEVLYSDFKYGQARAGSDRSYW